MQKWSPIQVPSGDLVFKKKQGLKKNSPENNIRATQPEGLCVAILDRDEINHLSILKSEVPGSGSPGKDSIPCISKGSQVMLMLVREPQNNKVVESGAFSTLNTSSAAGYLLATLSSLQELRNSSPAWAQHLPSLALFTFSLLSPYHSAPCPLLPCVFCLVGGSSCCVLLSSVFIPYI